MLDFSQFEYLTFDCYGTLIDWETGLLAALRPILAAHGVSISDSDLLMLYGELEADAETGPYRSYRQVLEMVVLGLAQRLGFSASPGQVEALPESLAKWPPFPDTVEALRKLKSRYKLVILSNVDDDLFAASTNILQVPFDTVITAQQVRSYKPSLNNFRMALERIGRPKEKVLHVAQSLYHDIAPTRDLGITNVWVNRRGYRPEATATHSDAGATKPATVTPDLEVLSLAELAALAVPS